MPGGRSEHGSLLSGNLCPSRVNSQCKSTRGANQDKRSNVHRRQFGGCHEGRDCAKGAHPAHSKLKISEAQFSKILKEYDQVNDQVHRADANAEPVEQLVKVDLRKRRLRLKDEIARYLAQA